ncbi:MAG: hypothetical protein FD137_1614 [Spirochaetes bacterium]|nr:MAG: hypothetical protein FD137_1614 [Spirochaetota bacterium]
MEPRAMSSLLQNTSGVEGLHLLKGLGAVPHGGVFGELFNLDARVGHGLDGILGAELGVLVSRLALEHDVLDLAVLVLVRCGVGLPVVHHDLSLHGSGLLGFGSYVIDFVPGGHVLGQGLAVEEHYGGLLGLGLFDDGGGGGAVYGIDGDGLHLLGEEGIDLVVLGGLGVLAVHDLDFGLVHGVFGDGVPHIGHEGVVELIDRDAYLGFPAGRSATAGEEHREYGTCYEKFFHYTPS